MNSLAPAFYLICATLLLSGTKVLVKYLGDVPTSQLILIRAIFILIFTYPILVKKKIKIVSKHSKLLLLRGLFGTLGMFLLFYVVQHTALATSVSLFYITPIFTVIIAQFLLAEKMPLSKWPWFILCFIGIFFIKSFSIDLSSWEFMLALGAAFFAALAYNAIRMLKGKAPPMLIVFYLPLVSAPLISFWAIDQWIHLSSHQWLLMILLCLGALAAQVCLTLAYQNTEAHKISHLNYLGLPLGILWGILFFNEIPGTYALIGVTMIFTGLTMSHLLNKKKLNN